MMKPTLVSFELCPFVQRSVITLLEKNVDFDITYIDLANPPSWFLEISPFGKVPVLRVGGDVIFESAVINEYLDDIYPPSMHPKDPLQKAVNRAWIEFASEMLFAQYRYSTASNEEAFRQSLAELSQRLGQLEEKLGQGPFFNGEDFCLIDAAFAPLFTRMNLLESMLKQDLLNKVPKVKSWAAKLVSRPSVTNSVVPDFNDKYIAHITGTDSFASKAFQSANRAANQKQSRKAYDVVN